MEAQALASYLPAVVRARIARGRPGDAPFSYPADAAVLLADLENSTGIIERIAADRSRLEALATVLNALFSDLIDEVYALGGDVLYIAGDAFVCYWPAQRHGSLRAATVAAVRAAVNVQQRLRARASGFGDPLVLRIGVSAGPLQHAFVGGDQERWELLIAGRVLEEVVAAERAARAGWICLGAGAWTLVQDEFAGRPCAGGIELDESRHRQPTPHVAAPLESHGLTDRQLAPYLPLLVRQRHDGGGGHRWLAEFRFVTVLMIELPRVDLAHPPDLLQAHACVHAFQTVMRKYEASIKVDVDDKGAMMVGVFGPPAHEREPVRAIRAAWELQQALAGIAQCHIGIAYGRALCAPMGNDKRREYMVCGDVVNRAARLCLATSTDIVCDEDTYRAAAATVSFERLPAHSLRGIARPVTVYSPLALRREHERGTRRFIGRERELGALELHFAAFARRPHPATVVIEAEAGVGKTSLLEEALRRADGFGLRFLRAQGDAVERASPWHAWSGVFAELLGIAESMDLAARRAQIDDYLRRHGGLERLVPLLAPVLRMPLEDNDTTRHMSGDARAGNTASLLMRVIESAVATPTVILVEDAHWFDSRSLELVAAVSRSGLALCTVVTTRPEPERLLAAADVAITETLHLSRFSNAETAVLIARRLGIADAPAELLQAINTRADGNPLFCEQIVQALIEAGHVTVEEGRCRVVGLEQMTLPADVQGMIQTRLDRLDSAPLLLLKAAAIVGSSFQAELAARTAPVQLDAAALARALDELVRAGFIEPLPHGAQPGWYAFRHFITRDVTYDTLTGADRIAGHRVVAHWLEETGAAARSTYALLAHHWRGAGELERALGYLERAGATALRSGSFPEALLFFADARELGYLLGIGSAAVRAAVWAKGIGTAHYFLGAMEASRRHIEAAVASLDRPVPRAAPALLGALLREVARQSWYRMTRDRLVWDRRVDKSVFDVVVDGYKMLGQLYFLKGESAGILTYLTLRGLNVGEAAGASPALACILVNMAFTARLIGLQRLSDWYAESARAMSAEQATRAAAPYVWHIDALREAQHARWPAALAANATAFALMEELGDATLATEAAAVAAAVTLCMGDIGRAREAARRARELAQANSNNQYLCWALLDEVEIALAADDTPAAAAALDAALLLPTDASDLTSTLDKQRAVALTRWREGRLAEAAAAADDVCAIIGRHAPTSYYVLDFYASAIEVLIASIEAGVADAAAPQRAASHLARLRKLARTFWNVKPRYWLLMAQYERARGGNPLSALRRAIGIAERMQLRYEEARACAELAQVSAAEAGAAARARVVFAELGQVHQLRRLQA